MICQTTTYFPPPLPFPLNDLPSKPGRDFPFEVEGLIPLRLSFLRSFRIAILSVRFFCLAAWLFVSCSLRSSLFGKTRGDENSVCSIMIWQRKTNQPFLLLLFSPSFRLIAFLRRAGSSRIFPPAARISALASLSRSSYSARFSAGRAANFAARALSCARAVCGSDETLCFLEVVSWLRPTMLEKLTLATASLEEDLLAAACDGPDDGSGTTS